MVYGIFTQYCEHCGTQVAAPMIQDARVTCRQCGQLTVVSYAFAADDPTRTCHWVLWRLSPETNESLKRMGI